LGRIKQVIGIKPERIILRAVSFSFWG